MRKTAIYFLSLLLLTAGIVTQAAPEAAPRRVLNAQDDTRPADNAQPSKAQPEAVEKSAEEDRAPEASATGPDDISPPGQEEDLTPSAVIEAETDDESAQPPAEVNHPLSVVEPDQSAIEAEALPEKEISEEEEALDFEIDRGDAAKTGEVYEAVREPVTPEEKPVVVEEKPVVVEEKPVLEEKPVTVEKREDKGRFWGLFGPGKEKKKAAEPPVEGEVVSVDLTPEELLAVQEEVRRQAGEIEGLKKLDQAYGEMGRNEFENALKLFQEALSVMPVRPHTVETRQNAIRSEAECAYRLALKSYLEGNIKGAKDAISRALEFYPAHRASARLSERIRQDELRRARIEAQPIPPKISPVYLDKQKRITAELQRGREYMAIKEYDRAESVFKNVLLDDKFNAEASANLKKISELRVGLESDEFRRMQAEMLSQIRDAWTPPVKPPVVGPRDVTAEAFVISQARRRLLEKLNNITIEKIDFRNANIVDVISYLHQQSVLSDPDPMPGERGVNIILNLRRPGEAARPVELTPAVTDDIFAVEGARPVSETADAGIPAITMTLTRISLMQALKYITESAGLKYRIEENVVVIYPVDVPYGELETRTYKIQPATVDTFMGGAAPAVSESDRLELGGLAPVTAERRDMKKFFSDAGIPFPEGTSIVYIPAQTLLIVKNTAENLESFERLLKQINVPPVQIEIEARFVEIGQNDLEEIGLEWLLTDNWELAEKQSGLPPSMRERIQMNKNRFSKGLRNLDVGAPPGPGGTLAGIMSLSTILTNPELTLILHALEQKDAVNLLSAPKLTTKSGASAEIKVVEELIYPTEFQLQSELLGATAAVGITRYVMVPAAFETRDVGVILQVTPTVGPDNETIDLQMVPQVVELARWVDYGYAMPTGVGDATQRIPLIQPVFHSRSIVTSISIWDGQTVVMGGLITEGQRTTEDKVPILGDIPLLGYLFRSKTSMSRKVNLLIFVTANLVDPAGNKIKKETVASLPAAAALATP